MFFNQTHENQFKQLEERFNSNNNKQKRVLHLVFAIPSIYSAFEESLKSSLPIDAAIMYLDDIESNVASHSLGRGEQDMLKLVVELWNGTTSLERGTFKLYDALNFWDDKYVSLFYQILQTVRPMAATQQ